MRLLVECAECSRQYDASKRRIGSRFRCHCGELITVEQPDGHDAAVVRCSACGAARASDEEGRCQYCEAEFTLHDRDLQTVCPRCMALVSDRARFCHHCGTGLVADMDAGTEDDSQCPACQDDSPMVSRRLGNEKLAILECGSCAGFWMGHAAFRLLVERAKAEVLPPGTIPETPQEIAAKYGLPDGSIAPEAQQHSSFYRPCVVCGEMMNRRSYGPSSGVIIDTCKEHGVWFDAEELARILAWIRAGGDRKKKQQEESKRRAAEMMAERMERPEGSFLDGMLAMLFGSRSRRW